MLQVSFLGELPTSEREAFAQRIANETSSSGLATTEAIEIFRFIPDEDRDDVARRAILLGGDAESIRRSLDFARQEDAAGKPVTTPAPPIVRDTPRTLWIVAGVLAVTAAGVTIWSFARQRRRR